jgi:hypothetical protein
MNYLITKWIMITPFGKHITRQFLQSILYFLHNMTFGKSKILGSIWRKILLGCGGCEETAKTIQRCYHDDDCCRDE